jgi:tetratricopeptide (TPR) repeat protein
MKLLLAIPLLVLASARAELPLSLQENAEPAILDFQRDGLGLDEIFQDAVHRRLRGDLDGAAARLAWLETQPFPEPATLRYQVGLVHEFRGDAEGALAVYDALIRDFPGSPEARDGHFRRALCLEDLDRHREAKRSLDRIQVAEGLDFHDRLTLDIQRGITLLSSGRVRRGLEILNTTLDAGEGTDEARYLRAKGYVARARLWVDEAARIDLAVHEKRAVRNLGRRAELLTRAQADVAAALRLQEPQWALEGLLILGRGYEGLAQDLLAAPPPRNLNPEQVEVYRQELEKKSRILLAKAWQHYDAGLGVAAQLQYEGRPLAELRAARDALSLDTAPR